MQDDIMQTVQVSELYCFCQRMDDSKNSQWLRCVVTGSITDIHKSKESFANYTMKKSKLIKLYDVI